MEFWSWVMAVILGLSAIISPIVTAIINNKYQLKLKNIEIYELSKRQCLENFISSAISYKYSSNVSGIIGLRENINKLYLFFNDVPADILKLYRKNDENYEAILTNIVQVLSKQIVKE